MASPRIAQGALQDLFARLTNSVVFTPSTPGYQEKLIRWSAASIKRAVGHAPAAIRGAARLTHCQGVIVCPKDTQNISAALVWSRQYNVDLAVRGGGHSLSGSSSSTGGLVIDLGLMNKISVDADRRLATAQGGAVWREVDEELARHGLAVVGGASNHAGVGGLTLGGGLGWLTGQHGLVIDNLTSATVVLASGDVVTASNAENPGLFWALRGAGHNFGIVVDFTFIAHEQTEPVLAGSLIYEPRKIRDAVKAMNAISAKQDNRAAMTLAFAQMTNHPRLVLYIFIFFNGSRDQGQEHFKELYSLKPTVDSTKMMPYPTVNSLLNPIIPHGARDVFKGCFHNLPLDPEFARSCFEDFAARIHAEPELALSAIFFDFYDMRKVMSIPQDRTAFPGRNATQNSLIALRWTRQDRDEDHLRWARDFQARFARRLAEDNASRSLDDNDYMPLYVNYSEAADWQVANVYGSSLTRLRLLKAVYDPDQVFDKMAPIEPLHPSQSP